MKLKKIFYKTKWTYIIVFFAVLFSFIIYKGNNPPVYEGGIQLEEASNIHYKARLGFIENTNHLIYQNNDSLTFYDLETGKILNKYRTVNFHKKGRFLNISTQNNNKVDNLLDLSDLKTYSNNDEFPIIILNKDNSLKHILHHSEGRYYLNNFNYYIEKVDTISNNLHRITQISIFETDDNNKIFTTEMPYEYNYHYRKYYQRDSLLYIVPNLNTGEKDLDNGFTSFIKINKETGKIEKTVVTKYDKRGYRKVVLPIKETFEIDISSSPDSVFSAGIDYNWTDGLQTTHTNADGSKRIGWKDLTIIDIAEYDAYQKSEDDFFAYLQMLFIGTIIIFIVVVLIKYHSRNYGKNAPAEEKLELGLPLNKSDIKSINDETILASIAKNDKYDKDSRILAIQRVNHNSDLLKEVFEKTELLLLRQTALEKINDSAYILKQYPTNSNDLNKLILEKTKNQELLYKIATEDTDKKNRLSAINRIKEDEYLIKIANATKKEDIKFEALKNISDTKVAADLGLTSNSERTKLWALKRCSDQDKLIEIAENDKNKNVRLKAINKNENQASLYKIATEDTDKENRLSALNRIKEDNYLIKIVHNAKKEDVKFEALKNISDTKVAVDLGLASNSESAKLWALKRCSDQDKLIEIAENDSNQQIRSKAINEIESQDFLIKYTKDSSKELAERCLALGKINSDTLLYEILQNQSFEDIHDIIRSKFPEVDYKDQQFWLEKYNETNDEKEKSDILKRITDFNLLTKLYSESSTQEKKYLLELNSGNKKLLRKFAAMDSEKEARELYSSGAKLNPQQIAQIQDKTLFYEIYLKEKAANKKEEIIQHTQNNDCLAVIVKREKKQKLRKEALAKITEMSLLKSLIPEMKEIIGGDFFDYPNQSYDKTKALCLDNNCPCPETEYKQGTGYLYVPDQGYPIFVCEEGAKLRGIDLTDAAIYAKLWWAAEIAPKVENTFESVVDNTSDLVVLCCPNPNCSGMISSRDAKLRLNLIQLSRGGMISGASIPCADCGSNSSITDWHNETVQKYGDNYLDNGEAIYAEITSPPTQTMKVRCENCNEIFNAKNLASSFPERAMVVEMIYGEGQAFVSQCSHCNKIDVHAIIELERRQNKL